MHIAGVLRHMSLGTELVLGRKSARNLLNKTPLQVWTERATLYRIRSPLKQKYERKSLARIGLILFWLLLRLLLIVLFPL